MKIEISESADGRIKTVFGDFCVVELDPLEASIYGQKLADRARFFSSLGNGDSRRTATTQIETHVVDDGGNQSNEISGGGGEAVNHSGGEAAGPL